MLKLDEMFVPTVKMRQKYCMILHLWLWKRLLPCIPWETQAQLIDIHNINKKYYWKKTSFQLLTLQLSMDWAKLTVQDISCTRESISPFWIAEEQQVALKKIRSTSKVCVKPSLQSHCNRPGSVQCSSMRMHLSPVWHGLPAPPPLAQKLPTPLHLQAHVEHVLYGFLETVEIVVDKSCVSKDKSN